MKLPSILTGAVLSTFLLTESAYSVKCERLTPAQHIDNSDIIFYGQLVREQRLPKKDEQVEVEFEVLRAYKGIQEKTVLIRYYNDDGGYLGWGFQSDKPTLIFARSIPDADDNRNLGRLGYCSMSTYHARPELHAQYMNILTRLKPRAPGNGWETTTEQ